MNDNQFATTMMTIIGVLVAFTAVILVISNILTNTDYTQDSLVQGNIQNRIQPVGNIAVAGEAPAVATTGGENTAATTVASNETAASKTAEQLYSGCAACHDAGVLNAPKLGDKVGWDTRLAKGIDTLYANAINGIGGMPAKGGRADYSDDEIKKVVDYMLESLQ